MMPPAFEYFAPTDIDEAIDILSKHEGEAKILAGGQSIIPLLKARISSIPYLVSLSEVKGLSYIIEGKDSVSIGAMTVDSDLENSEIIKKKFPILYDALLQVADPLVRNVGTIGGNLAHADPGNDLPAVMLALGATFVARGKSGKRNIRADEFFLDTFTTSLKPDEILTEIKIPYWSAKSGGAYVKFKKSTWNFSVAGVAVQLQFDGKTCSRAGIGLTSVAPRATEVREAEKALIGKEITVQLAEKVAGIISDSSEPGSDSYGSVEYKKEILRRISIEAIQKAFKRTGGN